MAQPVHVPRVNNNDDTVKLVHVAVAVGDEVAAGDLLLEVETEKATVAVEAESDGHVLALLHEVGETLAVGAIVAWLGATADEAVPQPAAPAAPAASGPAEAGDITAKARLLLRRHGIDPAAVPRTGTRLSTADVEAYLAAHPERCGTPAPAAAPATAPSVQLPAEAAFEPLSPTARGMLATVTWQRTHAAAVYLEIEYDPRPWEEAAAAHMRAHRLLLSPLLALMAHRLAVLAPEMGANGTVLEGPEPRQVRYRHANLGFTVQAGDTLYLCVVPQAETLDAAAFIARLTDLQRRALAHKLAPADMQGATLGFTSMARWGVRRHQPVLAPHTAVMVAHSAPPSDGAAAVLGITYDHRLLSGFAAVRLLKALAQSGRDGA